jgi:hypothetical protein
MASLFTEGWIGEHGNNAVPAGLRVYFGQHDKSLIDRHRQDDPTVVILVLVWIGYTAWPLYDLLVLVHAMETRDVGTVTRHVYFDAVHVSLTQQVVAAHIRRTRINISPFAQSMAAGTLGIAPAAVALASDRRHPAREYSEPARG